jgi:hypothetical protein
LELPHICQPRHAGRTGNQAKTTRCADSDFVNGRVSCQDIFKGCPRRESAENIGIRKPQICIEKRHPVPLGHKAHGQIHGKICLPDTALSARHRNRAGKPNGSSALACALRSHAHLNRMRRSVDNVTCTQRLRHSCVWRSHHATEPLGLIRRKRAI